MWDKILRLGSDSTNNVHQVVNGMQMSQKWIWKLLSSIAYFNFIPQLL